MNSKVYDPHCHKYLFFVVVVLGVLHYFKEKVTIIASLFDSSDFPYSFEVYDFCFLRKTDYKKLYTSVDLNLIQSSGYVGISAGYLQKR